MSVEVYETVFSGTLAGQFVQTVQHVHAVIATPVNPFASALLIAQDLATGPINSAFMDMLPSDYTGTSIRVRRVFPAGGATAIVLASTFTLAVGQRSGQISSAQVNPVITWIPTTDPEKTGRMFIPGVSESDIDAMVLSASILLDYQAFISAWIAGGTVGGVDTYVGSVVRKSAPPPPITVTGDDIIFAGQVSPLIGTQRRRLHPV